MKTTPLLSIITAAFNSGETIEDTLVSVKGQTTKDYEHIVVDGNSIDGTKSLLDYYEKRYELSYISEPDDGISDALNKGLNVAKGRYILVLHADDKLYSQDVLKKISPILEKERYDIFSFPVCVNFKNLDEKIYKPFPLRFWYHFKTIIPHQGAFIHRRLYEKIGGYRNDFKIALDYDFFYRAFKTKCTVKRYTECVAVMGGDGISNRNDLLEERLDEEFRVQKKNEENTFWRIAQILFKLLYTPYKTKFLRQF